MAETGHSQLICDAVKDFGAALQSQIKTMFEEQNAKMNKRIDDLIAVLRLHSTTVSKRTSIEQESSPGETLIHKNSFSVHSAAKTSSDQDSPTTETSIQKNLHSEDTTIAKLGFPRFNVDKMKEVELKALHETASIVDYRHQFELIHTRISLSEDYPVSMDSSPPPPPSSLNRRRNKDEGDVGRPQIRQAGGDYYDRNGSSRAHPRQSGFDNWQASEGTEGILPVSTGMEFKKGQCEKNKESTVDPRKLLIFEQAIERRAQVLRRDLRHRFLSCSPKLRNVTNSTSTTSSSLNDSELGFVLDVEEINDRCQQWQWRGKYSINYLVQGGIEGEFSPQGAVGVTEEVVAFAKDVFLHPETWIDFLLPDNDEEEEEFKLSDAQHDHALAVARLALNSALDT